jgi:hypothetical protein
MNDHLTGVKLKFIRNCTTSKYGPAKDVPVSIQLMGDGVYGSTQAKLRIILEVPQYMAHSIE